MTFSHRDVSLLTMLALSILLLSTIPAICCAGLA